MNNIIKYYLRNKINNSNNYKLRQKIQVEYRNRHGNIASFRELEGFSEYWGKFEGTIVKSNNNPFCRRTTNRCNKIIITNLREYSSKTLVYVTTLGKMIKQILSRVYFFFVPLNSYN